MTLRVRCPQCAKTGKRGRGASNRKRLLMRAPSIWNDRHHEQSCPRVSCTPGHTDTHGGGCVSQTWDHVRGTCPVSGSLMSPTLTLLLGTQYNHVPATRHGPCCQKPHVSLAGSSVGGSGPGHDRHAAVSVLLQPARHSSSQLAPEAMEGELPSHNHIFKVQYTLTCCLQKLTSPRIPRTRARSTQDYERV